MIDRNKYQHCYSPVWATHVIGCWNLEIEDGVTQLPIKFVARCSQCNTELQGDCSTGNVRTKINKFAFVHNHKG